MSVNQLGANQTEIHTTINGVTVHILYSYNTPVAVKFYDNAGNPNVLVTNQYYSKTTSKHVNAWIAGLPESRIARVTQSRIDSYLV